MNPRLNTGKGVSGAVRYVLGQGRDPQTGELKRAAANDDSRVAWMSGTGFGFAIKNEADAELARRVMEFNSLNQGSRTRQCEKDCVHLALAWKPGETPTRAEMEEAALDALKALGMGNAKALFVAHNDEDYVHLHIVASKINPATGRAYDLKGSWRTLSVWAEVYEREHGGVVSVRRQDMNELRRAIAARDAGAVLEAMTRQRSTFTGDQLERALLKEIQAARGATAAEKQCVETDRTQFVGQILARPELVQLADRPSGPVTRYTTRAVLEAEIYVLQAAAELAVSNVHHVSELTQAAVMGGARYAGITKEQARAFHHATGAEGIALIDGQAGTGKSFTIAAVREAYEAAGCRVIGLGPTNAVAQDMKTDGFGHAATIHAELFALNSGRRKWDAQTVVIVDEAAMLDTKLMALVTVHASEAGAKLILVGDDRQLSSIDRGGMFGALKDRYGAAALSEVKRQHKLDDRRASEWMAEGNFHDSLNVYDRMGAIHWTRTQGEARAALIAQWAKDSAAQPDKSRFVFAYTNDEVATLNAGLRTVRKQRGELGTDSMIETAHGRHNFAPGDRIMFTGTDKKQGITNGRAGTVEAIDGSHVTVTLDGRAGKAITFDAASFNQFHHGYAGTIYKSQGKSLDQTYLYHSEQWRRAASYVALTRHRDKTELFVATNTAKDVSQLARQMARNDERRAASQFHYAPEITAAPLTAAELHARFSIDAIPPKDQTSKEQTMQTKDGTAQAANQNAREQLDELATQRAASVRPAEPESGRYDNLKLAADFRRVEHEATDAEAGRISTAWKQPAFTHDTIRLDPWTAVYLPIPPNAETSMFGRELLRDARTVARDLQMATDGHENPQGGWLEKWAAGPVINHDSTREENQAAAQARVAELEARLEPTAQVRSRLETFEEMDERHRDEWELVHGAYGVEELPSQLDLRQAEERARLAWQQPAFSFETIQAEPWTAVYLPIPDNADAALLAHARQWASDLRQYADPARLEGTRSTSALAQPLIDPDSYPIERNFAAATDRLTELEARLQIATEARQTPEAANGVVEPGGAATAAGEPQRAAEPYIHEEADPALAGPSPRGDIRTARGLRFFLETFGDKLGNAFHAFADMIAPPPKLTAGQVHDRLQAAGNLETLHAIAVAEAQQVHESETDERIFRADQQQQQANLSFAERYGLPPTSEAVLGREHGPEPDEELEP